MLQTLWKDSKRRIRHWFWSQRLKKLGQNTDISLEARVQSPENVEIGNECHIGSGAYLFGNSSEPSCLQIGDRTVIREGAYLAPTDGSISIGNDSFVGPYTVIYGNGHVVIGDQVLIAARCSIASINHNFDGQHKAIAEQGLDCRPVVLEDNVWLGMNVTIVPGVRVGSGSVIAAGTTVYKDIPPNSFVRGYPLLIEPREREHRTPSSIPSMSSNNPSLQESHYA